MLCHEAVSADQAFSALLHPSQDYHQVLLHLSDINSEASFSFVHQDEWSAFHGILAACLIGKEVVVQKIIPVILVIVYKFLQL